MSNWVSIPGIVGQSASREVFMGFADGKTLHSVSFADVLDETHEKGYQRRFSKQHSLDFRRYIASENATTIPLTFNLRPGAKSCWRIKKYGQNQATLQLDLDCSDVLAQVDCQHRMGFLGESTVVLPFMTFMGLDIHEEMEVFSIINSKAKGLNASLLDFHASVLTEDLGAERPELLIALHLHRHPSSPWHNQLDLGGSSTSGLKRRASLRTMQKAIKRFLSRSKVLDKISAEQACKLVADFWSAVSVVLEDAWNKPRQHMVTKGVGVYALMGLAADLTQDCTCDLSVCNEDYWVSRLADFIHDIDWTNQGHLKGLGGENGAKEAHQILQQARTRKSIKVIRG